MVDERYLLDHFLQDGVDEAFDEWVDLPVHELVWDAFFPPIRVVVTILRPRPQNAGRPRKDCGGFDQSRQLLADTAEAILPARAVQHPRHKDSLLSRFEVTFRHNGDDEVGHKINVRGLDGD